MIKTFPALPACTSGAALLFLYVSPSEGALVGYWNFDNPASVGQAQVSDNLETVGNAAYSASGRYGGGLQLDGVGDYLRKDAALSLATGLPTGDSSFTVMAWIRTTAVARNGIIGWGNFGTAGQVHAFRTGPTAGEELTHYSWGAAYDIDESTGSAIFNGQWHHVAATYDSATGLKTLYFDGAQLGSTFAVPDLAITAQNFRIGATNHPFGTEEFNGTMDEMKVYNNALTLSEIQAAAVPEPSGVTLWLIGGALIGGIRRRPRQ